MPVYSTTPLGVECGDDIWDNPVQTMTVHENEDKPVDTGLVDEHGVTLWRLPTKHPVGFQVR